MVEVSGTKKITTPIAKRRKGLKKSQISVGEWGLIIGALGFIDLIELILGLFVIGEFVNTFIDWIIGPSLAFYLWYRGEDLSQKRVVSLVGSFILELIPFINDLPLWTLDGLYLMSQSRIQNREAIKEKGVELEETQETTAIEQRQRIEDFKAKRAAQELEEWYNEENNEEEDPN